LHNSILHSNATPRFETVACCSVGRSPHLLIVEPFVCIQSMNRKHAKPFHCFRVLIYRFELVLLCYLSSVFRCIFYPGYAVIELDALSVTPSL